MKQSRLNHLMILDLTKIASDLKNKNDTQKHFW